MVTIRNIRIKENRILLDCYKEGKEEGYFSLVIDAITYEIVSSSLEKPSIYARQAALKVQEFCEKGIVEFPMEIKSTWC